MDITKKFLELTSKTYPHGTEGELLKLLPTTLKEDAYGNLYVMVGDGKCMFTSHLDTASRTQVDVKHVIDGKFAKSDGKSILGADDKAGVTIMLHMIEKKIPGLYYFFLGEERGCIGSGKAANDQRSNKLEIEKVISFDRRGTDSVITHQSGMRCCSDEFANALANALNDADANFRYRKDNTGILTDSLEFIELYSECTNISVGYYSEHTNDERQDLEHLNRLAEACTKINWDGLPTTRKPETRKIEKEYDYTPHLTSIGIRTFETWSTDEHGNTCTFHIDEQGRVTKARLTTERAELEETLLHDFLRSIELEIKDFNWNGSILNVTYLDGNCSTCRRDELYPYIKDLDFREW
jgi:hypothetical protein